MDLLAEMTWGLWLYACGIIAVCCLLMLIVLIQRGRGSGLAGAFGGAGGSSAFGAKTGDILTWATVVVAAFFILLTSVANHAFDQSPQAAAPDVATGVPGQPGDAGTMPIDAIPINSLPINAVPFTPSGDGTTTLPLQLESSRQFVVPLPAGEQPAGKEGTETTVPAEGVDKGATPPPAGDVPAEAVKPAEGKKESGDAAAPKGEDQDKPTP